MVAFCFFFVHTFLYRHCKGEEKAEILDCFDCKTFEAGVQVITQGDNGDNFYVVQDGTLEVFLDGIGKVTKGAFYLGSMTRCSPFFFHLPTTLISPTLLTTTNLNFYQVGSPLAKGSSFGELALMYNTPRAATVKTSTACTLWFIDRTLFRVIVTHFQLLRTRKYVNFLASVEFGAVAVAAAAVVAAENSSGAGGVSPSFMALCGSGSKPVTLGDLLSKDQLEKVAGALESEEYKQGECIIRQGQEGDYFYIVEEGEVRVYKQDDASASSGGVEVVTAIPTTPTVSVSSTTPRCCPPDPASRMGVSVAVLGSGAYFGEKALIAEEKRAASCVAESATVKCLTLARNDFVNMLGRYVVID